MVDTITTDAQINILPVTKKQTTRIYIDGLGRKLQTVASQESPLLNDIVQPVAYDALGRQTKTYLPYSGQSTDTIGSYRTNALTAQHSFYNNTGQYLVARDTSPYAQVVIDNTPLQRVLQEGSVGVGFQPGQHYKTVSYRFNKSTDGNIMIWNPDGTFTAGNYYATGSLNVTDATAEDNAETLIFTDMGGNTVLKRQILSGSNIDTYYVYNLAGMVSYVIPPLALAKMVSNGSYVLSAANVNTLIFRMTYDNRGRLVQKITPGKGASWIIYDPLFRPVLMQDSNMRVLHKWNYIKYDSKGRAISQGIYVDYTHTSRTSMQNYVNGLSYTTWYETRSTASTTGYYTNVVFPTTSITPRSYGYFDDYDLKQTGNPYRYVSQGLTNEETATTAAVRGVPTMVRKTTIGGGITTTLWLLSATFYDKRGHAIQTRSNNQLYTPATDSLTDTKTVVPDFIGKPMITKIVKVTGTGTTNTNSVTTNFTYDNTNIRLKSIAQTYNSQASVVIASYTYNELGQVVLKQLGNTTGSSYLQNVDFRYNIRGQLLSINNSTLTSDTGKTNSDTNDLFGMKLLYDQVDAAVGNTADYTGKLSAVKWMGRNSSNALTNERSYKYTYDQLERYTASTYGERAAGSSPSTAFNVNSHGFDEYGISYDVNGNLLTLKRKSSKVNGAHGTSVDSLTYGYTTNNGNQLSTVTDGTGSGFNLGFRNYTGVTTPYVYDGNGNLKNDYYKGLNINYNDMNLTDTVATTQASLNGAYISYTYDAGGSVIKRQVYSTPTTLQSTNDYIDGFVYINGALSYFAMPEGRVINGGTSLIPEYVISDQQGNARFSFQNNGSNALKLIQSDNYYAMGEVLADSISFTPTLPNANLYNGGSEWQNVFNNLPDYHQTFFRNYDPELGRFIGVDPMAEASESMSVYQYANNNAVMLNDPMGNVPPNGEFVHDGRAYDSNGDELTAPAFNLYSSKEVGSIFGDDDDVDGFGGDFGAGPLDPNWQNEGFFSDGYRMLGEAESIANDSGNLYGGYVDANGSTSFQDGEQERNFAVNYNNNHDSWGYTKPGSANNYVYGMSGSGDKYFYYYGLKSDFSDLAKKKPNIFGISVLFNTVKQDGVGGVAIELGYVNAQMLLNNYDWIQTVTTSDDQDHQQATFNDPEDPDDDLPYYSTDYELPDYTNKAGFNSIFRDIPHRPLLEDGDVTWSATLQLVNRVGTDYYPILNITYGFSIKNGVVTPTPPTFSVPTNNQHSIYLPSQY